MASNTRNTVWGVGDGPLDHLGVDRTGDGLELRRLDESLHIGHLLRDQVALSCRTGVVASRLRRAAGEDREGAPHVSQARMHPIDGSNGPQHVLDETEHDQPEGDTDQSIANDGRAHRGPEALERRLVEREAGLIPAVRDSGRAKVDPCGDRGAGPEDQPEAAEPLHVG